MGRSIMEKPVRISGHALKRMARYEIGKDLVVRSLREPDFMTAGYHGRKIAHKFMNRQVLRVVYEDNDVIVVVTVYPARRERYEEAV